MLGSDLFVFGSVLSRRVWTPAFLPSDVMTLLRLLVDTAGTHSQRWTPGSASSCVWHGLLCTAVVPALAEVLWAWCQLSLVLTLLSPGVVPLPVIGLPCSGGISVPLTVLTEHGFLRLFSDSV